MFEAQNSRWKIFYGNTPHYGITHQPLTVADSAWRFSYAGELSV